MKKFKKALVLGLGLLAIAGCSTSDNSNQNDEENTVVKLGLVGDDTQIWDNVKERLADEGITIEYVKFTDYAQPNTALADGEIDLNAFQHQIFLDSYNEEHGTDLVSIGNTVNSPLGVYSEKISDLADLADGAVVTIPNDVTNGGRALLLLQTAGLIEVDEAAGQKPTVSDITANDKNLEITELDASQTARSLADADIAIINGGMAIDAGLDPDADSIFIEPVNETSAPYVNIIVARSEDAENEVYNKVVDAYQTEETANLIEEAYKGTYVPAWETFGRK